MFISLARLPERKTGGQTVNNWVSTLAAMLVILIIFVVFVNLHVV